MLNTSPPRWFRVEEVPKDELDLKDDELLIPVAHFSKEIYSGFGIPFLLKAKEGELFSQVKGTFLNDHLLLLINSDLTLWIVIIIKIILKDTFFNDRDILNWFVSIVFHFTLIYMRFFLIFRENSKALGSQRERVRKVQICRRGDDSYSNFDGNSRLNPQPGRFQTSSQPT